MTKYIIYFTKLLIFTCASLIITSCSDEEGYSLGDIYMPEFATVNNMGQPINSLTVGDSTIFTVVASNIPNYIPKQPRVILNYTILGDLPNGYLIKVNSIGEIITQAVEHISINELEKLPNDSIEKVAVSISQQYINMRFSYNYGGSSTNHKFNVYRIEEQSKPQDQVRNDTIQLYFRHDKQDDVDRWKQTTYRCFNLRSLNLEKNKKVILEIHINTENGIEKIYQEYTPF